MAEQNNQAERAAPKFLPCPMPDCGSDLVGTSRFPSGIEAVSCGRCGMTVPETSNVSAIERWNRRAAVPSAVDAEGLPIHTILSLERRSNMTDDEAIRFARSVESAIAADRRKRAALMQMIELGQEIEASGERQSIGADATFKALAAQWAACREMYEDGEHKSVVAAWAALIAYIDGRSAPAAGTVEKDAVIYASEALLEVIDGYAEQLVPINRKSATVNQLRAAIEAHNRAGKEQ